MIKKLFYVFLVLLCFCALMALCWGGIGYALKYDFVESFKIGFIMTASVVTTIFLLIFFGEIVKITYKELIKK